MRYCVTGATGFLGSAVARQLVAAGHQVVAVVRTPTKATALADLGVSIHQGDVTDKESLRAPMTGADGVFHIAGWYKVGVRDTSPGMAVNVAGTRNTLEMMRELGIPKGVYTSTYGVNSDTHGTVVDESYRYAGPFLTAYERTKWLAHYEIAAPMIAAGLPLVIVMPGVIYGPGDTSGFRRMWVDYLQHRLPIIPRGCAHCWGHVEDTARAHLLAMDRGTAGQSYIVAGPAHTLAEATALAQRVTGIPAPREVPPGTVRALARLASVVEKALPVPANYRSETLLSLAGTTYLATSAKAQREWGYAPRSLEEGLPDTLRHEMRLLGMTPPADG